MSKDMLSALGGGVLSAILSLAFLSGLPGALMAVYLAPLPLFLVGLHRGLKAETIAGTAGVLCAGVVAGPMSALLFAVIHAAPVWLAVWLALIRRPGAETSEEWVPTGTILSLLAALGAAMLLLAMVTVAGQEGGLEGLIRSYLDQIFSFMLPSVDEMQRGELIDVISPLFPGYMGTSWVVMAAVNGSIALAILVRTGHTERPRTKLADLVLPDWTSWALIGAAVVALVGQGELQYLGRNLALILSVPFFFLGLAVVHDLARRITFPGVLLTVFYLVLLLSGWIAIVIIGAGVLEQWAGLRRRFAGPKVGPGGKEDED